MSAGCVPERKCPVGLDVSPLSLVAAVATLPEVLMVPPATSDGESIGRLHRQVIGGPDNLLGTINTPSTRSGLPIAGQVPCFGRKPAYLP
jgi:hypothetical protein